ncbi:MAG: PAS domain S-box protein, partial [Chitinivibrionales bacterium]|nr:PAS domain S-box protein [Chitinivibrionales bacterium]
APDGRFKQTYCVFRDITELKQSQEALRRSEERYRSIFETAGVMMLALDRRGRITMLNPRGAEILECDQREAIGRDWFDGFLPKEDRAEVRAIFEMLVNGDAADLGYIEGGVITANGQRRLIRWNNTLLHDDADNIVGTLSSGEDITERKRAREQLAFRLGLEKLIAQVASKLINSDVSAMDADIDWALAEIGRFAHADRCYMFRYADDGNTMSNTHEWCAPGVRAQMRELQDLPSSEYRWTVSSLHEEQVVEVPRVADLPPDAANERRVLESGGIKSLVMTLMVAGGKELGFVGFDFTREETSWDKGAIALLQHLGVTLANALERRRAESELRSSEERYRMLVENANEAILVIQDRRVVFANAAVENLLGYAASDVMGTEVTDYLHPEDRERALRAIVRSLADGFVHPGPPLRVMHKHGEVRWFEYTGAIIEWNGQPAKLTMLNDVTERRRSEMLLEQNAGNLAFLSRTAMAFVDFPADEDIYRFIGDQISSTVGPNAVVCVCECEEKTSLCRPRAILNLGSCAGAVERTVGADPMRLSGRFSPRIRELMARGTMQRIDGGLEELGERMLPAAKLDRLAELLGLGRVYGIGLVRGGVLYGAVAILPRPGCDYVDESLIEVFIGQATVAIARRHAQQALHESEKRFRSLAESVSDGITIVENGRNVYVNRQLCGILGLAEERALQCASTDLATAEEKERLSTQLREITSTRAGPRQLGFWIQRSDGKRRYIQNRYAEAGGSNGVRREYVVTTDVTEHRLAQEAVRESEERFRQIAENIHEAFWLEDAHTGRLLYLSPLYETIWGSPRDVLLDDPAHWFDAVHPHDREGVAAVMDPPPLEEVNTEFRIIRPDGATRWIRVRLFPIRNDAGVVYRRAGIAADVTEYK